MQNYKRKQNDQSEWITVCLTSSLVQFQHVAAHNTFQSVLYYFITLKVITTTQKRDNSRFLNQHLLSSSASSLISLKHSINSIVNHAYRVVGFCCLPNKKHLIKSTVMNQKGHTMSHSVTLQVLQTQHTDQCDVKMTLTLRI